jgi:hypothetical protein
MNAFRTLILTALLGGACLGLAEPKLSPSDSSDRMAYLDNGQAVAITSSCSSA